MILPVLATVFDSPWKAVAIVLFAAVYQQIETYYFTPRVSKKTMDGHLRPPLRAGPRSDPARWHIAGIYTGRVTDGGTPHGVTGAILVGAHRGEPRWAMAGTVVAAVALHATLPSQLRIIGEFWIYPLVVGVLLLVLVVGDPGRIDKNEPWLRVVTGLLIAFITLVNAFSANYLVQLILEDADRELGGPVRLLSAGAAIWIINILAFGLWFWDLDQGGAAERAVGTTRLPALLFPEMGNPEVVRAGWAPTLPDYLHMSWGAATSLGPSDVSPIKLWSKAMMIFEAAVSMLLGVLIIARAINLLP